MQELATRARGDVELASISVAVCVFVFDLLYHDGESLVRQPLKERRRALLQVITSSARDAWEAWGKVFLESCKQQKRPLKMSNDTSSVCGHAQVLQGWDIPA